MSASSLARLAPRLPTLLLATLSIALLDCRSSETSIHLRLAPNPQLNSERQLLAMVDSLILTLDAPGGFKGVAASGAGPLTPADPDGDGMLELQLSHAMAGESTLPVFRLSPGQNSDRIFQAVMRGMHGQDVAAIGALESVRFYSGESLDLMMPFDLRASYRPPRVVSTSPRDTQTGLPPALAQVEVEFSKRVDAGSLDGQLRIVYQGSAGPRILQRGHWASRDIQIQELGLQAPRTVATFTIEGSCTLSPGTYRIEASTGIRDLSGASLDQDAAREGSDGYVGVFSISGTGPEPGTEPCRDQAAPCQIDPDCNPKGGTEFACSGGKCVVTPRDCSMLPCPTGYVCAKLVDGARCVEDCRLTGFCGGATEYCGEDGLCQACDAKATNPQCGNMVTEEVTCVFKGATAMNSCKSMLGYCDGVGSCVVTVTGLKGQALQWTSPCGSVMTTLDGINEQAVFPCSPDTLKEQVKCVFNSATTSQECYSAKGGCKGVGACVVDVSGSSGEKVEWKSSCGGYATTTIDGINDYATFQCATTLTETVTCLFTNSTAYQLCSSSKGTCKGITSCTVNVTGAPGESVTWTSSPSCPGQVTSVIDGVASQVKFYCK